jgi:nucleotide-binding universal stress UspA family protein
MEEQIDLIVMGTVGRSGISGLFIGNTAEKVLQKVDCSVLAVKPEGFVSPVKLDQ